MLPRQSSDTFKPVLPSLRYSIIAPVMGHGFQGFSFVLNRQLVLPGKISYLKERSSFLLHIAMDYFGKNCVPRKIHLKFHNPLDMESLSNYNG
jgi:hypothetical protein